MKIFRKILPIIIFVIIFVNNLHSQSIKLVRTDVDSARANFVTATYMFGFDVVIEDVEKCNGVEFELAFNNTNYVHYSDWKVGGFGENATTAVIPIIDTLANSGKVYVLVISGDPIHEAKLSDTTVIHLDFVVSQKAPHGRQVTFTFNNAHATVFQDSVGVILDLNSEPFVYDIHGFVDVWPGDTDNNGIVDEVDMDLIALHLFHGAPTKKMRSFKRENASTLWHAQRVLAWDSAEVTYADCDGDANITPYDMLVIPLNFAELHSINQTKKSKLQTDFTTYHFEKFKNSISIPVYIDQKEGILATVLRFDWSNCDYNILGFEKGDYFHKSEFLYANIDKQKKEAVVLIGNYSKNGVSGNGKLLNVIADNYPINLRDNIIEASCVTEYRDFISLNFSVPEILDVSEVEKNVLYINNDVIELHFDNFTFGKIELYSILGNKLLSKNLNNTDIRIDVSYINSGTYFIVLTTSHQTKIYKIFIDK